MWGASRSLLGLVEAARDRALSREQIARWHIEARGYQSEWAAQCQIDIEALAEEVIQLCLEGSYRQARRLADPNRMEWDRPEDTVPQLADCPAWLGFQEVVTLAERIDSFLAVLEREGTTRQLARDSREDLDLLCVLSDWCQDNGMPQAAAEARHLHTLVQVSRRP
jgi:hypothetical protein